MSVWQRLAVVLSWKYTEASTLIFNNAIMYFCVHVKLRIGENGRGVYPTNGCAVVCAVFLMRDVSATCFSYVYVFE